MTISRRRFLHQAVAAGAVCAAARGARAEAYPARPLRWVVGFPPGGGADIVSRIMAPWLAERLGQPVVIENKPGASSNISIQAVVNSPPDGYTLLFIPASAAVNVSLFDNLQFNLLRDIAPVSGLIDFPLVMVANPSLPAKTVPEFIAYAKANPGKISVGSFGTGSTSHVAGELFKMMTGINMIHVPYRGGAAMLADVVGGQVQVAFDVLTGALAHIRSGSLRALAVCRPSARRSPATRRIPGAVSECRAARRPRSSSGSTARSMRGWRTRRSRRGSPMSPPRRWCSPRPSSARTWRRRSKNGARWSRHPASGRSDGARLAAAGAPRVYRPR
jgi:tripartite-type tricarboxylate transporter receptor subunit TctC